MPNYYYNGVELPAIPEWDQATYPYRTIFQNPYNTYLAFSNVPYYRFYAEFIPDTGYNYQGEDLFGTDRATHYRYKLVNDVWEETGYVNGLEVYLEDMAFSGDCTPIWANYNMMDANDVLILPASEPVQLAPKAFNSYFPLGEAWANNDYYKYTNGKKVKQTAYATQCGEWVKVVAKPNEKPSDEPSKQPIAYLFKGEQLPPLPSVDRNLYPYTTIEILNRFGTYATLRYTVDPQVYNGQYVVPGNNRKQMYYYLKVGGTEWIGTGIESEMSEAGYSSSTHWADYDIISTVDGSVYLPASDPVPVYA